MSLALLLEKYDVSTEEGLQKALNELEEEDVEVDEALSSVLSRASSLEGRLRTASQAYTKLGEVKNDAHAAADMVERTAALARDVSAKVRQLDLARSRVAECQLRVHDLIDLQLCSAGVEAAIKAQDYETGAGHVARFLSMDPRSVAAAQARGAPDPRAAMSAAAAALRTHLHHKMSEASRAGDAANVERLFKLFPLIGQPEEGVDLLAAFLADQLESTVRRVCAVRGAEAGAEAAVFADAFTRLLEAGGAAVERARTALHAAPGLLPRALALLQPKVCAGARRLWSQMRAARGLEAGGGAAGGGGPLSLEPALAELAHVHATIQMYCNFVRRKTESDAAPLGEAARSKAREDVERILADSELVRTGHELLATYLQLERYFLEESINKALKMATAQAGSCSSSLVDDVFFIARKVIRRAVSARSADGVCAALNEAAALLERGAAGEVRRALRTAPPDVLPLPGPRAAPPPASDRDSRHQARLYLAHLAEAAAGAEWAERLATEAYVECEPLYRTQADRDKVRSCAEGLSGAAAAFQAARAAGVAGVRAALLPRLCAWGDALVEPRPAEDMEDDADALPAALETLAESAQELPPALVDELLLAALQEITARAEKRLLRLNYCQEGGLCVERRARRLAAWCGARGGALRERVAPLVQAAALLAGDRPWAAPGAGGRLPPAAVLARRIDFKMEDIKKLNL